MSADPVLPVDLAKPRPQPAAPLRAAARQAGSAAGPTPLRAAVPRAHPVHPPADLADAARPANPLARPPTPEPGPTPWATGLPIAAFVAVFLTLADVALCRAFAEAFGWLWIPANLLVGVGLAPSLWLLRRTPLWRWPALGAAVGLGVSWVALLLAMLGPPQG